MGSNFERVSSFPHNDLASIFSMENLSTVGSVHTFLFHTLNNAGARSDWHSYYPANVIVYFFSTISLFTFDLMELFRNYLVIIAETTLFICLVWQRTEFVRTLTFAAAEKVNETSSIR